MDVLDREKLLSFPIWSSWEQIFSLSWVFFSIQKTCRFLKLQGFTNTENVGSEGFKMYIDRISGYRYTIIPLQHIHLKTFLYFTPPPFFWWGNDGSRMSSLLWATPFQHMPTKYVIFVKNDSPWTTCNYWESCMVSPQFRIKNIV